MTATQSATPARASRGIAASTIRRTLIAAIGVAIVALILGLALGGGAPQASVAGIPDPGKFVGWGLPILRTLADLAALTTIGLLLAMAFMLPAKKGKLGSIGLKLGLIAVASSAIWGVLAWTQIAFTLADFLGQPLSSVFDPRVLWSFVTQITQGRALLLQGFAALVIAIACLSITTSRAALLGLLAATATLLPPTLTGHSGASSAHEIAVSSLMAHVIAASLWAGGLVALVLIASIDGRALRGAVPTFSKLAIWCVVALGLSGVANAWIRMDSVSQVFTTWYGRLILIKVALLIALTTIGYLHRQRTMPALEGPRRTAAFVRLALVEVLLMATTFGIAVALSRTPPPVTDATDLSNASAARIVLGYDLPPAPTAMRLIFTEPRIDAFFVAIGLMMIALYAVGLQTLSRRGIHWPIGRTISGALGVILLMWSTSGSIANYSHVTFSAHMINHMFLSTMIPILLVLAAPVTLALRALPAHREDPGPREWLLSVLHSRVFAVLGSLPVAAGLFVGSFFVLYFSPLFPFLMGSHWGHVAMEVHFLLVGYLFFWTLIGVDPGPKRASYPLRILVLVIAMSFHAFFNIAVMSSTQVLAGDYYASLKRPYLTDLLADQTLGAGVGWAMGELPLLIVMCTIALQWVRSDARDAKRYDRQADRAESGEHPGARDELAEYNAYLAQLEERSRRGQ